MQPAIELKRKLLNSRQVLGVLITNHLWLELIEIAIDSGLDYVIVDGEHLDHGATHVADACRVGRLANFPVLIRPPRSDAHSVRIAMDLGPCGLLLPMVESARQLDDVRDGAYLPPRGNRRPGGPGNSWLSRFDYEEFKSGVEDHLIVLPQVESPLGVSQAAEIAAHPLTTALAVGPYDLATRLGCAWQPDHPDHKQAISQLRAAAEAAGKPFWMIGDGPQLARQGFRFLCIAEPSSLLRQSLTRLVADVREAEQRREQ
jgi:4-hydroxy-2-oxoheptanedioate aldolase